jgi:hypothetical protein
MALALLRKYDAYDSASAFDTDGDAAGALSPLLPLPLSSVGLAGMGAAARTLTVEPTGHSKEVPKSQNATCNSGKCLVDRLEDDALDIVAGDALGALQGRVSV